MSRIGNSIFAASLIAAGVTPLAPASPALADPKPEIQLCRDVLLPGRPASNLGECLSYIMDAENGSQGEVAHHCDTLEENDPETFDMLFVSKSECIQAFGSRGHFKN
jgi:hypothetical protein